MQKSQAWLPERSLFVTLARGRFLEVAGIRCMSSPVRQPLSLRRMPDKSRQGSKGDCKEKKLSVHHGLVVAHDMG